MGVVYLIVHGVYLQDNLLLARWIPSADVLIWTNIQPIAAGLLAGIAWKRMRSAKWQRIVLLVPLLSIAIWRAWSPLFGSGPELHAPQVRGMLVRQTSLSSCSAAAAATALRVCGLTATEAEMARLCFTSNEGTTNLGLYRGLKIKTDGTAVRLEIYGGNLEEAPALWSGPMIIDIGLPGADSVPWPLVRTGVSHSIVILSRQADGKFVVADPQSGMQTWPIEELRTRWIGGGLRLVRR